MINRRTFLRSSAGAAALGGVALSALSSEAAQHRDADLLALGAEFDQAFANYKVALLQTHEKDTAFVASHGPYPFKHGPQREAYLARYAAEVQPLQSRCDEIVEATDALTARIRSIAPKTLAGVAVKARTLRFDLVKWGDDPKPMSEWNWDDECLEGFIREMELIGGGA